jgi:hypothetical protein
VLTSCANSTLTSSIVTFTVGKEGRLFAAHEDVLSASPFFAAACRGQFLEAQSKRIDLPDEEPEIFSCVLEYLYVRLPTSHSFSLRILQETFANFSALHRRATTTPVCYTTSVETLGNSRMQ